MRYDGKPLFEEQFAPVWDAVKGEYVKVLSNRFVHINNREEISHDWTGVNVDVDVHSARGLKYGVSLEQDGATAGGLLSSALFDQSSLKGSLVNMTTRMAGTARVEAGAPIVAGSLVTVDDEGRAITCTDPETQVCLGQAKEDAAIGSLIFIRFNGM